MSECRVGQRGCFMTQGLYLKANGEMPCWDDVGEKKILRKLDFTGLIAGHEENLSNFAELAHIRKEFREGRFPFAGLCEKCAVRQAGLPHDAVDASILQVLHVEPSYMCHLSCPQCVPQKQRKSLKGPPYHLPPAAYDAVLAQLQLEGVREIRVVIFEGRGDPLSCADLEKIIDITKARYPMAVTSVTTHGSFPYKPWIARSQLDILRFSVDGARQEAYQKYRVGGDLSKVLAFMEAVRKDKPASSPLYLEWKYILFEWNDADDELAAAAEIAGRIGIQLRFCRTHSPGKSQRYQSDANVLELITRLAPRAITDLTFQLKAESDFADVGVMRLDQVRSLMREAQEAWEQGHPQQACTKAIKALALGDELLTPPAGIDAMDALADYVLQELPGLYGLVSLEGLAALFSRAGRRDAVARVLERYMHVRNNDPSEQRHLKLEISVQDLLYEHERGNESEVDRLLRDALASSEETEWDIITLLGPALQSRHTGLAAALANIYESRGYTAAAILMYELYLDLAPKATDAEKVARQAASLRSARALELAQRFQEAGQGKLALRYADEAVSAERVAVADVPLALARSVEAASSRETVERLGALALTNRDFEAAYVAEHRLRTEQFGAPPSGIE